MTPLEKLEKIFDKLRKDKETPMFWKNGFGSFGFSAFSHSTERTLTKLGHGCPDKEDAINYAYNKLFPPIPSKVGRWEWDGACYRAGDGPQANSIIDSIYWFGCQGANSQHAHGVSKKDLADFLKLIEVNPNLDPPTEE